MWFFAYLGNDQDLNTIQNQFKKKQILFFTPDMLRHNPT